MVKKSSTSITVKWDAIPGSFSFDPLSGYKIRYRKSGSDNYASMDVRSDQTQAKITNLKSRTTYKICVAGFYTSGKEGPYSEEINAETPKITSTYMLSINIFIFKGAP